MKVGDNIKAIREAERNYKQSYMAERLGISTRAYSNIESNVSEITVSRLIEIAEILECDPTYILNYQDAKRSYYNYFHNYNGNHGINNVFQGSSAEHIEKLYEQLLASERSRISLLEELVRNLQK
jgi:transcriptional regulator with XRE-family HTH domain